MMQEMPSPPDLQRLHEAIGSVDAPPRLRAQVGGLIAEAEHRRARRRRIGIGGGLAAATAAAAATVAIVVPGGAGGAGAPTVVQVAALSAAPALAPAPPVDPSYSERLALGVGGVAFPAWRGTFAWRASGRRTDTLEGRRTVTVFYRGRGGTRLSYSIVAGDALAWPRGARIVRRHGTPFRTLTAGSRRIVTWRERGHQCVIAAPASVPVDRLLALARWSAHEA